MKEAELAKLLRMADKLRKDPDASKLFQNGMPEMSFMAKDPITGIWMLTRPDFTPGSAGRGLCRLQDHCRRRFGAFGRSVFNYDYDIQAALALDVVAAGNRRDAPVHVVRRPGEGPAVRGQRPPHRARPDHAGKAPHPRPARPELPAASKQGYGLGMAQPNRSRRPYYIQRRIEEQEYAAV